MLLNKESIKIRYIIEGDCEEYTCSIGDVSNSEIIPALKSGKSVTIRYLSRICTLHCDKDQAEMVIYETLEYMSKYFKGKIVFDKNSIAVWNIDIKAIYVVLTVVSGVLGFMLFILTC